MVNLAGGPSGDRPSFGWNSNRRPHPDSDFGALDEPLPVASVIDGIWKPRHSVNRTSRRLATLINPSSEDEDTSALRVCIAGDQFIVVASNTSSLCVYQLSTTTIKEDPVKPWSLVSLRDEGGEENENEEQSQQSAIVSLTALPFGQSLIYGERCRKEEGYVVAFTDDGQGFIVRIRRDSGATKVFDFRTMNFGVTCASVIRTSKGSEDCQLLVGYQSGYLESWKIFRFSADKTMAKLVWRGMYPDNHSIQSIAPLNVLYEKNNNRQDINKDNKSKEEQEEQKKLPKKEKPVTESKDTAATASGDHFLDTPRYLLITLLSPLATQTPRTETMLEVIDLGSMDTAWKSSSNEESLGHLRAILLNKQWILPHPGMEILSSSTNATSDDPSLPKRTHCIPSQATGSICALPQNGNGVALADGTVALLSAREINGELEWGIANDYNQLLLSYPAIGCAHLSWCPSASSSNRHQYIPHVACCLRGGTTYVIPVVDAKNNNAIDVGELRPLTVYTLDAETDSKYVQSFTAGNLNLSNADIPLSTLHEESTTPPQHYEAGTELESTKKIPVLIYGWAGGILDIYSCELMDGTTIKNTSCRAMVGRREILALEELVSNGSVRMLNELLLDIEEPDPLLQQPMWTQAKEECLRSQQSDNRQEENIPSSNNGKELTLEQLLLPEFSSLCALLLSMATNKLDSPVAPPN